MTAVIVPAFLDTSHPEQVATTSFAVAALCIRLQYFLAMDSARYSESTMSLPSQPKLFLGNNYVPCTSGPGDQFQYAKKVRRRFL